MGHEIWGSTVNRDYISTFYSRGSSCNEKVFLQIDILDGDTYYTYLHRDSVFDVNGRSGSFFAVTLRFHGSYTTCVYKLFQLFEIVYKKVVLNSIIKIKGEEEVYLVGDFASASVGSTPTINLIQSAFNQKIEELIVPGVVSLPCGLADTFNKSKKTVSLLEVDSPLFINYFKKYSVIVSPNLQPSAIAYDSVINELKQVKAQKSALFTANNQLQSQVDSLKLENTSLSEQLHESTTSFERKYKSKMDKLQSDIKNVVKERDALKQKMVEAASSIELIDQPFQKLTRLLAGRFPENSSSKHKGNLEEKQSVAKKSQSPVWRDWLNSILLGFVLICCCVILVFVLKGQKNSEINIPVSETEEVNTDSVTVESTDIDLAPEERVTIESANPALSYDSWEDCILDIQGGGDNLHLNKTYILSVTKGGKAANIPSGEWSVYVNKGEQLNKGNSFTISNNQDIDKNIMIEYLVDGQPVKTRVCKIIQ